MDNVLNNWNGSVSVIRVDDGDSLAVKVVLLLKSSFYSMFVESQLLFLCL